MTGLRLGFVHGPQHVVQQMIKLQQFTFVCAPHPVQWAGVEAWEVDLSDRKDEYQEKRDRVVKQLQNDFEITGGGGAFYLFLKTPWGTGTDFVKAAIERNLLIIPGNVFSEKDTHFRLSFAAEDHVLDEGCRILRETAQANP